jgi:hypothetical protein
MDLSPMLEVDSQWNTGFNVEKDVDKLMELSLNES